MHKRRWNFTLFVIFAAAFLAVGPRPALAVIDSSIKCSTYFQTNRNIPTSIRSMMNANADSLVRICSSSSAKILSYISMSPVSMSPAGVCSFQTTTRIAGAESVSSAQWPVETQMAMAKPGCPKQTDSGWIGTEGVSETTFIALLNFERFVCSSAQNFDSALALSKDVPASVPKDFAELLAKDLAQFRSAISRNSSGRQLILHGMKMENFSYEFAITDKAFPNKEFDLTVELRGDAYKIVQFSTLVLYS